MNFVFQAGHKKSLKFCPYHAGVLTKSLIAPMQKERESNFLIMSSLKVLLQAN